MAGPEFQNGANAKSPQRIRIPFDITLSNLIFGLFPLTGVSPEYDLSTSLTTGGQPITNSSATMDFALIAGADPYCTKIPTGGTNEAYLSQDLRVFSAAPKVNNTPFPTGPTFTQDNPGCAYSYIKALLGYLNGRTDSPNPAGTDPFSLLPGQDGEGQTDSSVAPFVLTDAFPPLFANNYNFAIARVRLSGIAAPPDTTPVTATNVRVFFRVFQSRAPTQTSTRTAPINRTRIRQAIRERRFRARGTPRSRSSLRATPAARLTISRAARTSRP